MARFGLRIRLFESHSHFLSIANPDPKSHREIPKKSTFSEKSRTPKTWIAWDRKAQRTKKKERQKDRKKQRKSERENKLGERKNARGRERERERERDRERDGGRLTH